MSRFDSTMDIFYQTNGSNWGAATQINFDASQMPQYPFQEFRISDKVTLRNLNGDAWTFQNYNKAGYRFRWTYLDETKANQIRLMFDANPYIAVFSGTTFFGTCILRGDPTITETQFELYDVEMEIQEI